MLQHLAQKEVLVYSCGSLWTSIVPCLALRGVASAIAKSTTLRAKVLLRECLSVSKRLTELILIASCPLSSVNSNNDRETDGYTAVDYVSTIVRTLNESKRSKRGNSGEIMMPGIKTKTRRSYETNRLITHLVYLERGKVEVDLEHLQVSRSRLQVGHYGTHQLLLIYQALGVTVIKVPAEAGPRFTTRTVAWAMQQVNRRA